jgi:peptidyl-prolyl cis-trans isomerase C
VRIESLIIAQYGWSAKVKVTAFPENQSMRNTGATSSFITISILLCSVSLFSHAADKLRPADKPISGDTVLVTVNGQPVRRALFDGLIKARTEQTNPYDEPDEPATNNPIETQTIDKKAVFEDLLTMEILAQKARERGIHQRPEIVAEAELQYKTLLQQELVREIIAEIKIDPAEIQARYDAQKPERSYNVSHILLKSEQDAIAVIRELNKGAKFQTLAKKRTIDNGSKKDGKLGWMMASQLEASFVAGVETMKQGGYSQKPVQTPYGWHVVQLHGARYLDKPPFATAQTWLRQEILHEKVSARLEAIKKQAKVEVPNPK